MPDKKDFMALVNRETSADTLAIGLTIAEVWRDNMVELGAQGWELDAPSQSDWVAIADRIISDDRLKARPAGTLRRGTLIESIRFPLRRKR